MVELFENEEFKNIKIKIHHLPNMSINNWLNNTGLPKKTIKAIYDFHLDSEDYIKKSYNMKMLNGDIIMDWISAIVSGIKP